MSFSLSCTRLRGVSRILSQFKACVSKALKMMLTLSTNKQTKKNEKKERHICNVG